MQLCIQGGLSDAWTSLPTETSGGVECVRLTATRCPWLVKMLFGVTKFHSDSKSVIEETIDYCRSQIKMNQSAHEQTEGVAHEEISAQAKAILDSDSDSDEDGSQLDATAIRNCSSNWTCIDSEHGPITVRVKPRLNALLVEATPTSLVAVSNLALSFKARQKAASGRSLHPAGSLCGGVVPGSYLKPEETSKIQFNFRKCSWQIKYRAIPTSPSLGKDTNGLEVMQKNIDGTALSEDFFILNMKEMLAKARRLWNIKDKSTEQRIKED
jgi:hypothetical protein